jgi:competence ComEA-like helix-hairpin-helix protein
MSFRQEWKDFFYFNRRERNGLLILLFLIILLLGSLAYYRFIHQPTVLRPDEKFLHEMVQWEAFVRTMESKSRAVKKKMIQTDPAMNPTDTFRLFPFNPNRMNDSLWQQLGVPSYLSQRIMKYVSKGGSFKVRKDLLKIYGMDTLLYERLQPWITLPDSLPEKRYSPDGGKSKENIPSVLVDLNKCTMSQLMEVKGIGQYRASQILNYRNQLGGYYSLEQLLEVYGIDHEVLEMIRPQITIQTPVFRSISLKNFYCKSIRHPYLSRAWCERLEKRLFLNPNFSTIENLLQEAGIPDSIGQRLMPYLRAE